MPSLHTDEIPITIELVQGLLEQQFPEYANLPLSSMRRSGSSNIQFKLGDKLLVRLPRQPGGGRGIVKERRWTSRMGDLLPVPVPEIIALGEPCDDYIETWSITRWENGTHPKSLCGDLRLADQLAEIVLALKSIPVTDEARDDRSLFKHYRGRALAEYDGHMQAQIEKCRTIQGLDLDLDLALDMWRHAMKLPGVSTAQGDYWVHTDIVVENLLVEEGEITCLLDFGGLGIGDPTVDLHGAWELFDEAARTRFREQTGVDDATWLRGRAWALAIAVMTFPYYWGKSEMKDRIQDRLVMAQAVLSDSER